MYRGDRGNKRGSGYGRGGSSQSGGGRGYAYSNTESSYGRGGYGNKGPVGDRPQKYARKFDKSDGSSPVLQTIDWEKETLTPFVKSFYCEHPRVTARPQRDIDAWCTLNEVTIDGVDVPRPIFEFDEANYPRILTEKLYENFSKPTIIQSISWPLVLSGRDIVSIAKTGSGKTLAFLLPALVHIIGQTPRRSTHPAVLVLLPTRELAQQVQEVGRAYCQALNISLTCLFGGAPRNSQIHDLERGVDLVVATPGRLMDFLNAFKVSLKRCTYLVLDEADRMLDMGFEPQIRKIISQIRPDRQTLMFSATWPREVRKMASDFLSNAVHLNVGSLELSANHNITQVVEIMDESHKQQRLVSILLQIMNEDDCKTIIFVETKRKADEITRWMRRDGWPALCIHGDKGQSERDWALSEFKNGKTPILLATDVAARGLDVDDIKYVINYDYSNNSEDYVHRIGRTGRREKKGTAFTFFTYDNGAKAKDLVKVLEEANQNVPDELLGMARNSNHSQRYRNPMGGGFKRTSSSGSFSNYVKRGRMDDHKQSCAW